MSSHDLIDTWLINHRINLYLLDAISPETLPSVPTGMKGRSVAAIFAHMHSIRLTWLEVIAPKAMEGIVKVPTRTKADLAAITKDGLRDALTISGETMGKAVQERLDSGKTSVLKPTPTAFIAYLISHESYHRGEICMTLTEAGHKLPDEILYGQWEWEKL